MAGSVNKVILIGNLGADPEIRRLPDGRPVVNLRLATTDSWRDKATGERKERTEWHRVVIFNDRIADVAERPLLMPALPRLTRADRRTPADRRRDPTTRAVPTCQEATRAVAPRQEATRAVAIRRAAATPAAATLVVVRRAAATPNAERNRICPDLPGRQVRFCRQRYLTPSTA